MLAKTAIDGPASIDKEAVYGAWGEPVEVSTVAKPRHQFVDFEPDRATGYYYMGARVYDPTLRRWLSPDPLLWAAPGLEEGNGAGLNLYAYADNDPVGLIDPQGTDPNAVIWDGGSGCMASQPDCQRDPNPFSQQKPTELSAGGEVVGAVVVGTLSLATDPVAEAVEAPGKLAKAVESGDGTEIAAVGAMILINILTRGKGGKVRNLLDEGAEAVEDGVKAGKKAKKKVRTEPKDLEEQLALEEAKGGASDHRKPIIAAEDLNNKKYQGTHDKMSHNHDHGDGTHTEIHYYKERGTGERSGFKFKNQKNTRGVEKHGVEPEEQ